MANRRDTTNSFVVLISIAGLAAVLGCETYFNQTASLGSATAGGRGTVRILFINNTEQRAVFTYGMYDQTDRDSQPAFDQFRVEEFENSLEPGESSEIDSLPCARVFAVGSERLLEFIENNQSDVRGLSEEALVPGVHLYSVPEDEDEDPALEGSADAEEYLIGTEFNCESLLIVRIEINDAGPAPFRLDYEVVPAESTR